MSRFGGVARVHTATTSRDGTSRRPKIISAPRLPPKACITAPRTGINGRVNSMVAGAGARSPRPGCSWIKGGQADHPLVSLAPCEGPKRWIGALQSTGRGAISPSSQRPPSNEAKKPLVLAIYQWGLALGGPAHPC